jgi:signal transduction histidine kinase
METEKKYSLLIIDDEEMNLKILTHILGSEYTIYTAIDGLSGIKKAKEYMPDLILLDILMPDMDGYQTLAEMKKCEEIKKTPVIFITGLDSDEDEEKGLSLEAVDYITKPFRATIVKLRVRNQIQLKSAVVSAESANRSKSTFLARMSHEIRTPLNAILGISTIQLQDESLSSVIKEAFTKIFISSDLLLGIINDILDMSKIEAGKLDFFNIQYDVAGMINDTVFLNMIKYEHKPIKFILNVDENVPSALVGDEMRIKQILNNLLSNAFKYTASGEVELAVSAEIPKEDPREKRTLVFHVRDTGQGMTEEQVGKLFDEYSRFNLESNRTIEGTGLGMSILKNLIQMMNGNISAESKPGKGSLFTVRLLQDYNGSPALGREAVEKLRQFRLSYDLNTKNIHIERESMTSGKVLIVDDVDINLYVAKEMLSPYGLHIDLAESGAEAIEKITQNKYDLVFMDHIMPVMDGIETTKKIREWESEEFQRKHGEEAAKEAFGLTDSGRLPIIALTANVVSGVKEMFLTNGFNGFLSKPIGLHELDNILMEWILPGGAANN